MADDNEGTQVLDYDEVRDDIMNEVRAEVGEDPTEDEIEATMDRIADERGWSNGEKKDLTSGSGAKVNGTRADSMEAARALTADLLNALMGDGLGAREQFSKIQRKLYDAGHYTGQRVQQMTRDSFQTLVDEDGGVFLPTTVSQEIFNIMDEVGIFTDQAMTFPVSGGRLKIPRVTGDLTAYAVNEGSEIQASKHTFESITLDPAMWGTIVPWTRKIEREVGQRLLDVVQQKIAEAFARKRDDTIINGDGGSSFHGIRGILQKAADGDVSTLTAPSGATTFDGLDPDDYRKLIFELPPSIRFGGRFVMHSDRKDDILDLKDDNNRYYYLNPNETASGETRADVLWGQPVDYTEQGPNNDSSGEPAAIYYHPGYLAFGQSQNLTTDRLTEATVQDPDGGTIRLGSTYSAALRVIEQWDVEMGDNSAFAVLDLA